VLKANGRRADSGNRHSHMKRRVNSWARCGFENPPYFLAETHRGVAMTAAMRVAARSGNCMEPQPDIRMSGPCARPAHTFSSHHVALMRRGRDKQHLDGSSPAEKTDELGVGPVKRSCVNGTRGILICAGDWCCAYSSTR